MSASSPSIFFAVDFADSDHGWAAGMFGEVVHTTNGGLSRIRQTTPPPCHWLYDAHFLDANVGWAVGFDGRVLGTTDGGNPWTVEPSGTHAQLNGAYFVDAMTGWVVGENGITLRTAPATTAVDLDASPATSRLVLAPNQPNPFKPRTTIRYRVPTAGRTSR